MLGHVGLMNFLWRFDMLRNTERYTENEVVINFLNDQFPDTNCDNTLYPEHVTHRIWLSNKSILFQTYIWNIPIFSN